MKHTEERRVQFPRKAVAVMRNVSLSRNALLFQPHIKSGKITALRTTGAGTKNAFAKYFDFVFEPADSCGFFVLEKEQRIWII